MKPTRLSLLYLSSLILIAISVGCTIDDFAAQTQHLQTPTITATLNSPPPLPVSMLTITVNLNVRTGPGTTYSRIGQLAPGDTVTIIGTNEASSWWQIRYPDNSNQIGWVSADAAYGQATDIDAVPVVAIPATPTGILATATPTPTPPAPNQTSRSYPPIPAGKSLLYVFNFHGEEMQFNLLDRPESYLIPGKRTVPEGAHLELFLEPGFYRWSGIVQAAGLQGEGAFTLEPGQIQGLGLSQRANLSAGGIEGFLIGSDPLAPPVTPTPTAIPTPPTPGPGKSILIFITPNDLQDPVLTFLDQKHTLHYNQRLFLELDPGYYDMTVSYFWESDCPKDIVCISDNSINYKFELPANQICQAKKLADDVTELSCQPVP